MGMVIDGDGASGCADQEVMIGSWWGFQPWLREVEDGWKI
jgi:hypothetical protein